MITADDLGIVSIGSARDVIGDCRKNKKYHANDGVKIYKKDGMTFFEMTRPNNFHVHWREIEQLMYTLQYSVAQFWHVLGMPNLKHPLIKISDVLNYCNAAQAEGHMWDFQAHTALYLTDNTTEEDIRMAYKSGILVVKLYPSGATTNSDNGVTDIRKMGHIFALMEKLGMKLSIHSEIVDPSIDFFDREKMFIDEFLEDIIIDFPELHVIFEHVSTQEGVEFVRNMPEHVVATITPQHMLFNRNDLLAQGMCPSKFCFPVVNRRRDQIAIIAAATSGHQKFFLGTDSAPHPDGSKYCEGGKGGCFTEPYAVPLYMKAFEQVGALDDRFEAFASFNGADFYGLPRNTTKLRLVKKSQKIVEQIEIAQGQYATPMMAGETLDWSIVK